VASQKKLSEEELERKKKEIVIASAQFREWWEARSSVDPQPSDPYRAFMIDKSLFAKPPRTRVEWEQQPNRRDIIADYPQYAGRKAELERYGPKEKVPVRKIRAVESVGASMSERAGMKKPSLIPLKQGYLVSRAYVGKIRAGGELLETGSHKRAEIGMKGASEMVRSTAAHEYGHIAHANMTAEELQKMGLKEYQGQRTSREKTYMDEAAAWKLARPEIMKIPSKKGKRAKAFWLQGFALKTYRTPATVKQVGKTREYMWE
jgi:hypothetical protein